MNEKFERLIERAEQLIGRIESVLPQALSAPDWSQAIAWRYRKRSSGHGALEPVRHVGAMQLADLKEIDGIITALRALFDSADVTKAKVVEVLKDYLPNFAHIETGKGLDQKM